MPCVYLPGPAPAVTVANSKFRTTISSRNSCSKQDVGKLKVDLNRCFLLTQLRVTHSVQEICLTVQFQQISHFILVSELSSVLLRTT